MKFSKKIAIAAVPAVMALASTNVDSKILSKLILEKLSILVVPGALFYEKDNTNGDKFIRIAFANISVKEIKILFKRLESFQP